VPFPLQSKGNGLPFVFVVDLVGQRGSDRRPTVSSLYNMLRRKPLANNAQWSFQHRSEKHPAIEIWFVRRDQLCARPRKPGQDR